MSKQQLIQAIRQHNQSAAPSFLDTFDEQALQTYLQRLTLVQAGRGPGSTWVRQGPHPAVIYRHS